MDICMLTMWHNMTTSTEQVFKKNRLPSLSKGFLSGFLCFRSNGFAGLKFTEPTDHDFDAHADKKAVLENGKCPIGKSLQVSLL